MITSNSKLFHRFGEWASRFMSDCRGNIAVMAGLVILPIAISVEVAVDSSRFSNTQSLMASALDAALLSAAKKLSNGSISEDEQVRQYIEAMLSANLLSSINMGLDVNIVGISINETDGTLSADIQAELPMAFMALANIDTKLVSVSGEVAYGSQNVELIMMLDVTGSMKGSKIKNMKSAAKDAIDILLPSEKSKSQKIRIGLVPYSSSVNASPYAYDVTDANSDRCVTGRSGKGKFTDAPPDIDTIGADPRAVEYDYCPSQALRPLTSSRSNLIKDISAYSAGGSTAGHLGVAWSYYTLSPNWKDVWPQKSLPKSYKDDKTLKIVLLMTDGEFNTYFEGTKGRASSRANSVRANNTAKKLCQNMKKDGIIIYSIAFEAPESARSTLQNCATPDTDKKQFYFDALNWRWHWISHHQAPDSISICCGRIAPFARHIKKLDACW